MIDYTIYAEVMGLPVDELRRRVEGGGLNVTMEQMAEIDRRFAERRWAWFEEAVSEGDFSEALGGLGSEERATAFAYIGSEYGEASLPAPELRRLLHEWWPMVDASAHVAEEIVALFRRAGYVNDTGRRLEGELTVYRGNLGEDPRLGISWTLSRAKARWFAQYANGSPRALFLGLERIDGEEPRPTVWRATVAASDVLGYFGSRRESEVVLDPATVRDVER